MEKPIATSNGGAIAALVVGIIAVIFGWVPFLGVLVGTVAIILAAVALSKINGRPLAIAGMITGGLGILISLAATVIFLLSLTLGGFILGSLHQGMQDDVAANQAMLDAKKDFAKGDTAIFEDYEAAIDSVKSYQPEDDYSVPADGKEFVAVTVTIRNIGDLKRTVSPYEFKVNDNGKVHSPSYLTDESFKPQDVEIGDSITKPIIFELIKDGKNRKLIYQTSIYDLETYQSKDIIYSLSF